MVSIVDLGNIVVILPGCIFRVVSVSPLDIIPAVASVVIPKVTFAVKIVTSNSLVPFSGLVTSSGVKVIVGCATVLITLIVSPLLSVLKLAVTVSV